MNYKGPGKSSSVLIDVVSRDIPTDTAGKKTNTLSRQAFPDYKHKARRNTNLLG
jgi:hypothetical protein